MLKLDASKRYALAADGEPNCIQTDAMMAAEHSSIAEYSKAKQSTAKQSTAKQSTAKQSTAKQSKTKQRKAERVRRTSRRALAFLLLIMKK